MRISELSKLSGLSAATIKFYVRDRLLPEGRRNGYNRTDYDETHLERLRLIRALIEVGGLSLATTQRVLAAIDESERPLGEVLGTAQRALPHAVEPPSAESLDRVAALVREHGWRVGDDNPGLAQVALAFDAYAAIGREDLIGVLPRYSDAAQIVAEADLDIVAATADDRQRTAETVVVGTVLGDRLLAGLRRIAQEHVSRRRYGPDQPSDPDQRSEHSGQITADNHGEE